MIYDTGDTHANEFVWEHEIHPFLSGGDILIINGDFGLGFWNGQHRSEELFFDWISEQKYTILFVDGNHSDFSKLNCYPIEIWNSGRVHKIRHNLIHLIRGEVYIIEGKTFFVFGGGNSFDKSQREASISWWPEEMPSDAEYKNGWQNLEKIHYSVDYIITHTAPTKTVHLLAQINPQLVKNDSVDERPLTDYLEQIQQTITYKKWMFGHFHVDYELPDNQIAVMHAIRDLESGRIVKVRDSRHSHF